MNEATTVTSEQLTTRAEPLLGWARRRARDLTPFVTLVVLFLFLA